MKPILGYDYLWLNVRVKGGAYGVMNSAGRSGEGYFVSYRDPNLKETDQVFEGVADYLEQFDADERDMTKYVIGTISDMDTPLLPPYKGAKAVSAWYSGITDEMLAEEEGRCWPHSRRISAHLRRLSERFCLPEAFALSVIQRKSRKIRSCSAA